MTDSKRGFAAMDKDMQKKIAKMGGEASGNNTSRSSTSGSNTSGAAGSTEAAKKDGQNSHRN